jgi:hypothetical protein
MIVAYDKVLYVITLPVISLHFVVLCLQLHVTYYETHVLCSVKIEWPESIAGGNILSEDVCSNITVQNFMNHPAYCEPTIQSDIQDIVRLLGKRMIFFIFRIDRFWAHSYPEVPRPHSHTRLLYYHFDISKTISFIHISDYNFGWIFQLRSMSGKCDQFCVRLEKTRFQTVGM